jgi:hypothetical protein
MPASTFLSDAIMRPGSVEIGALFPALQKQFLVRQPLTAEKAWFSGNGNEFTQASPQDQRVAREDLLVRLPSLRESKWKVTVLQRWIGLVEQVETNRFVAVVNDATNSQNPPEQVEVDLEEVSTSDLPLLAQGATFYWCIGYRDTPGGQRERISTLRFARQPHLSKAVADRAFALADRVATLLESD